MKKILFQLILFSIIAFSCQREIIDTEQAINASAAIGNWMVTAHVNEMEIYRPFEIEISQNLQNSKDSITITDANQDFWAFQVKALSQNDAFRTDGAKSTISSGAIKINIMNGKVINHDSIYFEIQFEDDEIPFGTTYKLMGSRLK